MSLFDFKEIKRKIIGVVAVLAPEAKIYLFGSRARQTHHESSDIDIALDAGGPLPIMVTGEIKDMLSASNIPYKIDVVDLHLIPEAMRANIIKEGVLWKD